MQVGDLGVSPNQLVGGGGHLLQLFFAREAAQKLVDAHARRQIRNVALIGFDGGRVSPQEVASHQTVETTSDQAHTGRRATSQELGQNECTIRQLVIDE